MQVRVASAKAVAKDLAAFISLLHRTSQDEWFRTLTELELSITQIKALHLLEGGGELSVKDLSEALSLSLPATSRAVDGLVGRGLVFRRECPDDRRSRRISLTTQGQKILERVLDARLAGLTEFVDGLSADQRTALHSALEPLVR